MKKGKEKKNSRLISSTKKSFKHDQIYIYIYTFVHVRLYLRFDVERIYIPFVRFYTSRSTKKEETEEEETEREREKNGARVQKKKRKRMHGRHVPR